MDEISEALFVLANVAAQPTATHETRGLAHGLLGEHSTALSKDVIAGIRKGAEGVTLDEAVASRQGLKPVGASR